MRREGGLNRRIEYGRESCRDSSEESQEAL